MSAMTSKDKAARFRRNYQIGLITTVSVFALLALRKEKPSRTLSIMGAVAGSGALYVTAAWPATRRVAADLVADKVAGEIEDFANNLFQKK